MAKCEVCLGLLKNKLGRNTPMGYIPALWAPTEEDPEHFYVVPEREQDKSIRVQDMKTVRLCDVLGPVARPRWISSQKGK